MEELFSKVCTLPVLMDAWKPVRAKGAGHRFFSVEGKGRFDLLGAGKTIDGG